LIWPTPRVAWSQVALTECWYSQLSSTLTPSAGGGGKGSPSSPGNKIKKNKIKKSLRLVPEGAADSLSLQSFLI